MAYSLARRGDGLAALTKVSRSNVPWVSVLVSIFFGFVAVLLNWLLPDSLLGILLNAVGAALLVVWALIVVAQLRLGPRLAAEARVGGQPFAVRSGWHPWYHWAASVALAALVVVVFTRMCVAQQFLLKGGLGGGSL